MMIVGLMQCAYDSLLVLQFISYNFYTPDKLYALPRLGVSFPQQGVKCHPLAPLLL